MLGPLHILCKLINVPNYKENKNIFHTITSVHVKLINFVIIVCQVKIKNIPTKSTLNRLIIYMQT